MVKLKFNYFDGWDKYRFYPGLELLESFIAGVESDCAADTSQYDDTEKQGYWDGDPDEGGEWVHVYRELDSRAWDLKDVFHNYFPTLRRGSALAMLCSFLEHELNVLCNTVGKHLQLTVTAKDLHGQGIERARNYLKLCGGVEVQHSKQWESVKRIFEVRHALIHAGGHVLRKEVQQYVEEHPDQLMLQGTELVIRVGYLQHVIATFRAYGNELGDALRGRFA
ncbi:hypothetical protein [Ralstonia pseudosolanacearum]|uniref:hypothetical protein n=1 Tax=Ralstonia pseudosolanacearum TaxID=1310165 RepID=UPI003870C644